MDATPPAGEEEDRREGDTHVAATAEKLDLHTAYQVAVIDECQMIAPTLENVIRASPGWTRVKSKT